VIRHVGTLHPARYNHPTFLADLLIRYVSSGMVLGATTIKFSEPTSASSRPAFGANVRRQSSAARHHDPCSRHPSHCASELTKARWLARRRCRAVAPCPTPSRHLTQRRRVDEDGVAAIDELGTGSPASRAPPPTASPVISSHATTCVTTAAPHCNASATTSLLLPASFLSGEREKRNKRLQEERKR
jgi:hypothetical protein